MALQFSTTYRNAMLDQLETTAGTSEKIKIFTGSAPANCGASEAGTLLVEYDMASDSMAAASDGAKALNSLPLTTTAVATGTMGHFRLLASDGTTCHMQGTVTATGGGGDMTFDNTSVTNGQTVNLNSFTLTAPGV